MSVPYSDSPFDSASLEKLRISQDFAQLAPTKFVLSSIDCRKPNDQEFVRASTSDDRRFNTYCLIEKESGNVYIVAPELKDLLARRIVPMMLVLCLRLHTKIPFIWPLRLPDSNGSINQWHQAALNVLKQAETSWVQMYSDQASRSYYAEVADDQAPEPDWSVHPTILEALPLAFRDRIITTMDHPLIKRLRGSL